MDFAYQLNDVRYYYDKTLALSLPELDIPAQKITTLIGANGSGKSTLLNLLAFLESPKTGSLSFFAHKVILKRHYDLRKQIGFLPQKPYMFRGSVAENLNLVLKLHKISKIQRHQKINSILEQLNIVDLGKQQAKTLSGGELQKVALARALITAPKVLLMDEPFSYLDQSSSQLLEKFMQNYVEEFNSTLIFSTHNRLQGLAIADSVVSLVKGKLIKSPLINLFNGLIENGYFKTAHLSILPAEFVASATHVSIDPHEIVLSRQRLDSSMRNQYQGRVIAIAEEMGAIRVSVKIGEVFQVLITPQALSLLTLSLGESVWLSFKANSVVVF